jgi:hypothetical protein
MSGVTRVESRIWSALKFALRDLAIIICCLMLSGLLRSQYVYADGPTITITSGPSITSSHHPSFTFDAVPNSPPIVITCQLDSGSFTPCSSPYSPTVTTEGAHSVTVKTDDGVGGVDTDTRLFLVDTTEPDTFILSRPDDPTTDTVGIFEFSANEMPAFFECSLDGASFTACTSPYTTATLGFGSHTFEVRARDGANLVDASPASFTWIVESNTPPDPPADFDLDIDGIPDLIERAGPNDGDANGDRYDDGVVISGNDSEQGYVTSFVNSITGRYNVLQTDCTNNHNVSVSGEPADHRDPGYDYTLGLVSFSASGCAEVVTVTQYFYGNYSPNDYTARKYNSLTHTYSSIPDAIFSTVAIGGQSALKLTYQIVDNGPLDQDPTLGAISDPIGVGHSVVGAPNTGLMRW